MVLRKDERIDDLEYKGLKIIQNKNGFCFGIDAVLLSDFAKIISKDSTIVDLGAGTGIISIQLSGKTQASKIIGIEKQKEVSDMARRSVQLNKLENVIEIMNMDLRQIDNIIEAGSIDYVVTNPPYQKKDTGILSENEEEKISRHEIKCNIADICYISAKILKNNGTIYMVHRPERLVDIIFEMRKFNLEPKKIRFVQPSINKKPNLVLISGTKNAKPFLNIQEPIIVYNKDGSYTEQILNIYSKKTNN